MEFKNKFECDEEEEMVSEDIGIENSERSENETPTTSDEEFIDDEDAEDEEDDLQILFNEIHLLRQEVNFLRK